MNLSSTKKMTKEALYGVGALGALHRKRNRDTLTVLMFHRVIAPGAAQWSGANPLFTMSTRFFTRLLQLIQRHYSPVSLEAVARARRGEDELPPRALLISFDDGWADNADFAAPILRQAGVPAVFFVATGAVKRGEAFWQERLYAAVMAAGQASSAWTALKRDPEIGDVNFAQQAIQLISGFDEEEGRACLAQFDAVSEISFPRMMTPSVVSEMADDPLFDFGTHGVTHTPFTSLEDPAAELNQSWQDLSSWCEPAVQSLSFPHGQYSPDIWTMARSSGYDLIFSSEKTLSQTGHGFDAQTLGRFEIRPPGSDPFNADYGRYQPDAFDAGRIAAEIFFRPHSTSGEV